MADAICKKRNTQFKDRTNQRYGRLVVQREVQAQRADKIAWLCLCDCGKEVVVVSGDLSSNHTKSCGCHKSDLTKARNVSMATHGMTHTAEFESWNSMKDRCYNCNTAGFKHYGGRGIFVCDRWLHSFEAFHADMGNKPSRRHTLDRIDTNGNYEPLNCRWALPKQQQRNRRNNRRFQFRGRELCLAEIAEETKRDYYLLHNRLRRGWSIERAVSQSTYEAGATR